ncbi:MAG: DoxX family protein [Vulcanimicrobiaceae bacterium]
MIAPLRVGPRGDIALLLIRVLVGTAFVIHGLPKIQHPAGWLSGTLPHVPAWLQAIAAFAEFGGGIALIAGFATPLFAFLIACNMVVAILFVLVPHGATFVTNSPGGQSYELPAAYLVLTIVLILLGPGAYAVDAARGSGGAGRSGRRRR